MVRNVLLMHVLLAATVPVGAAENWPQFLAPGARGVAGNRDLPDGWSAIDNVRWKVLCLDLVSGEVKCERLAYPQFGPHLLYRRAPLQ